MSKSIVLVSKDIAIDGGVTYVSAGLALYDGTTPLNAYFLQPTDLTEAVGGMTDYGMLVFNDSDSDLDDIVTIGCVEIGLPAVDANITSVDISLEDLMDTDVGDALQDTDTT